MSCKVEYQGGIPELPKTGLTAADAFPDGLVVMNPGFSMKKIIVPFSIITGISLNPGAKKNIYALNVSFEREGFKSCVVLVGKETAKLYGELQKAQLKWLRKNPTNPAAPATGPSVDVAAELQKFHELMEKGVITEAEFNAKKTQLLGL